MEDLPDNTEILAALDQSGFLLEQHVAAKLDQAGYAVRVSAAYRDPDEGKPREIDVVGLRRVTDRAMTKRQAWKIIVIECKSSPLPHVAFLRPWTNADRKRIPWEFYLTGDTANRDRIADEWAIHRVNSTHRAVQVVKIERNGKVFKARSDLLECGMPAIKAAQQLRRTYGELGGEVSVISFPAAVVGGPIYSVEPVVGKSPQLIERDFVTVSYENRSEWMSKEYLRCHYDLVSFAKLDAWLLHIDGVVGRVAQHLRPADERMS